MGNRIMGNGVSSNSLDIFEGLPDPTSMGPKHYPIRDDLFFTVLEDNIVPQGWEITRREYLLDCNIEKVSGHLVKDEHGRMSHEWEKYFRSGQADRWNSFSLYGLESETQDYSRVVAGRNSSTKHFSGQLGAGNHVTVCANLMFYAAVVVGRKHTRHMRRDLPVLMNKGMTRISEEFVNQDRRIEAYKETDLTEKDADHIIMEALRKKAVPSSQITAWEEEYREPSHEEFEGRTAWSLQNAFTEVGKRWPFHTMQDRTCRLTGVMDTLLGVTPVKTDLSNIEGVEDVEVITDTM